MKQMDTILKAVGIKTKECRLEEKGSGSLFSPLAKKSQQAAGSEPQENAVREEDAADGEALPASHAHRRDSPSCLLGETSLPCPDRSNSGDSKKQAAGEGENSSSHREMLSQH